MKRLSDLKLNNFAHKWANYETQKSFWGGAGRLVGLLIRFADCLGSPLHVIPLTFASNHTLKTFNPNS